MQEQQFGIVSKTQEIKDPFTRLLDLTLGWGEYVEKTEADYGDSVKSAEIYAVYQSVAEFAEPYWEASQEVQEQAVRTFVEAHLLPLLLTRQARGNTNGMSAGLPGERDAATAHKVAA